MALHRCWPDRRDAVSAYADLILLFCCLRRYERAEVGSSFREWLLTSALTLLFSYKVAAGFGYLTFNSGMAVYRCWPDRGVAALTLLFSYKANRYCLEAGNFTDDKEVHEIRAQECRRPRTAILGRTGLPLGHDWSPYMGQPMKQEVPGTCALVACSVCVEAVHRIEYEKLHGTVVGLEFPSRLGLRNLFIDCAAGGIWVWGQGAYVGEVLIKIQEMGGLVVLTNSYALTLEKHVLPLRSWEEHWWGHYGGHGLSPERVAQLLWKGPCIGSLWVVGPWYGPIDAEQDEERVYTSHGCGRNDYIRRVIEGQFPAHRVGWHAVVCYGYRVRGGRMHVLVLDNHTTWGPRRWVHVEEFDRMYTLTSLRAPTSGRDGQPM